MNYQKIYNDIIARGKRTIIHGYFERHHIVPKCLGGSNDCTNIVELTPEEHYVCHQLLVKIYPASQELLCAAMFMAGESKLNSRPTNKMYGWLKKRLSEARSGSGNPMYGKKHTPESIEKIREAGRKECKQSTKDKISASNSGKVRTDEQRRTISDAHKGIKPSLESRLKNSQANLGAKNHFYGKKHSEETKRKISETKRLKKNG